MRRSDLSTLRKTFIWPSEWYNDSKYYNLLFEDLKIFNYLIGIFYRLKCPTSLFKIKRLSNNFIIISMDIYIMYDIHIHNYFINKMKLYYIYYYWRLLMKNFFYLLSNYIFVNNSLKIKRKLIISIKKINKKKRKVKSTKNRNPQCYRAYKKRLKNIIIKNIKNKKLKKNNLVTLYKLQQLRTFNFRILKRHLKKNNDIVKIITLNYSKMGFNKKNRKIRLLKKKKVINKLKEWNNLWYLNINNYIYLLKLFFELQNNYLFTNTYFSPLLKNFFYSNGITINSFINNINMFNYFFKWIRKKKVKKKVKKWIPWEEYKLRFIGKNKFFNKKKKSKKIKNKKSKYSFFKNILYINKRIKNKIKLDIIKKQSFFFNVNNKINKTYGNNRWLSNFLLLSYLNNLDVNLLNILFNNNWFINSFLYTKKNINLINNNLKIKKWLLSINLLKKINNKYKLKGLLKNNLILFNSWFLKNTYKYFIENAVILIKNLILKIILKKEYTNKYKYNLIKDSIFFILINNYICIKKTNLFIQNTTDLISININKHQSYKMNIKNNLKIMSTLFFLKKVRRYKKSIKKRLRWYEAAIQMSKLMHSIEITFAKYSNKHYLIMPNYYYKTKPMLSSAKLICEYICFLFEKGYRQKSIYKKIKNWQYLRPWIMKKGKPFPILKTRKRLSLSGIRILCTGPFRKAKRKKKFHYHLWLRKYRLYGKMPLQSFNHNIDYYNLAVRLKYASRGIKVWLLFEKKKNEKKIYL
jgi:hypothetical protein